MGLPNGSAGKESSGNVGKAEDMDSISEWERFPGGGNGNSLQYSCLKNPMDRGDWLVTVHGVAKSRTRLSDVPVPGIKFTIRTINKKHGS